MVMTHHKIPSDCRICGSLLLWLNSKKTLKEYNNKPLLCVTLKRGLLPKTQPYYLIHETKFPALSTGLGLIQNLLELMLDITSLD